jgi:hypothetical protein
MSSARLVIAVAVIVAAGGAFLWWQRNHPPPAPIAAAPVAPAPAPPAPPPPEPAAPAIRYPVPPAQPARGGLPSLDDADRYVTSALVELLGRKPVSSFLHIDGFVRGFVATVNNLATETATSQLWPVKQTGGHFETERHGGDVVASSRNADRYAAFVRFAEGVDTQRAVALYVRLYPLFQSAYEELGYPGKYFNDRVIEVIDDLAATPTIAGPIKLKQIKIDGSAPASGGLYLYEDPALEMRSAGQKILLRMGRENASALLAKLRDVRQRLVAAPVGH